MGTGTRLCAEIREFFTRFECSFRIFHSFRVEFFTRFECSFLLQYGLYYYPSKWWAIALPCYLFVTLVLGILSYAALSWASTRDLSDPYTISDPSTAYCDYLDGDQYDIAGAHDIPIETVNRLLYPAPGGGAGGK
jgi:hypothetical protein